MFILISTMIWLGLMNWWRGSSKLIVYSSIVSLLFSCKSDIDKVSATVRPSNTVLSTFYKDDFQLTTDVVAFDSFSTGFSNRLLVGNYEDSVFGRITSNAFIQFVPNQTNSKLAIGPNTIADSVVFRCLIKSNSSYYVLGDTSQDFKINIHRLSSQLASDRTYYRHDQLSYNPEPEAVLQIKIPAAVNSTVTSISVNTRMSNSLAQEFIANPQKFLSGTEFKNFFNGLAFVNNADNAAMWALYEPNIDLYFHNFYGLNNILVSDYTTLGYGTSITNREADNSIPFSNTSSYTAFHQMSIDRSGKSVSNISSNAISSTLLGNACYVQAGTGVGTRIFFPFIEEFKNSVKGKILVDRAELLIKPAPSSGRKPSVLFAYELDSLGSIAGVAGSTDIKRTLQNELYSKVFNYTFPYNVTLNTTDNAYRFVITTYLQALIDGNKSNHGIQLMAGKDYAAVSGGYTFPILEFNGMKFYNNTDDPSLSPYNIQLKVHYTPYQ